MFKRLLNFGLLFIITIIFFTNVSYAQSDPENPFISYDKKHEERLMLAKDNLEKDNLEKGHRSQRTLSNEDLKKHENNIQESSVDSYIVKFKDEISMADIFEIVKLYDFDIIGKSENHLFILEIEDLQVFQIQSANLIEFIEKDEINYISTLPSDPLYSKQWALPATKIPEAWNISKGSDSVYVAVIDSGINRQHPDLINADIRNGWDYIFDDFCDWDSTGHGTNVTGIIGAETNNNIGIAGVNWNLAIIPLRVISTDRKGYVSDTIKAIYDAADLGSHVINLSLGNTQYSYAESLAVSYATSKGSIVVASAGNDGNNQYIYPASYEGVISVGAINSDYELSSFSQYNDMVDVVAPGEQILTTADRNYEKFASDYTYVSGTSLSAPYVSGIAALASAIDPGITSDEFMDLIKVSSQDLGEKGLDSYYGYGLVNASKILHILSTVRTAAEADTIWSLFEDIDIDKRWNVEFNMELDESSWNEKVKIIDSNGERFPVSVSKSSNGKNLIIEPLKNYDYNSNYTISIEKNVASARGIRLKNSVYIPFKTHQTQ